MGPARTINHSPNQPKLLITHIGFHKSVQLTVEVLQTIHMPYSALIINHCYAQLLKYNTPSRDLMYYLVRKGAVEVCIEWIAAQSQWLFCNLNS